MTLADQSGRGNGTPSLGDLKAVPLLLVILWRNQGIVRFQKKQRRIEKGSKRLQY